MDHQVVSMVFDSGVTVVFTVTMHSDKGNRHIHIHGTDGSIEAEFSDQRVKLFKTGEKKSVIFEPINTGGSHGGGDITMCTKFIDCVENNSRVNHLSDGVLASAMALAADESRKSGKIIDMRIFADYMNMKK